MCDLNAKTACALLFGLIAFGLTCAAISSSQTWYQDVETAVGMSSSGATALSLSWTATLTDLCIQAPSYYNQGTGSVAITPTCWSLKSNPVAENPNSDATISFLQTNYLSEMGNGLNMLQKSSSYTTAALAISIVLGLFFMAFVLFIGLYNSRYPVGYVLCAFKFIGFLYWLSTCLAFIIYAGGVVKASEDFTVSMPGSMGPVALINSPGFAHTTGFAITVGAHGLVLLACCFGLCIWPSEIITRVDPQLASEHPSALNAVNGLPNVQIIVPGLKEMGANPPSASTMTMTPGGSNAGVPGSVPITSPNASFFAPSASGNSRGVGSNGSPRGNSGNVGLPVFTVDNPAMASPMAYTGGSMVPRPPQQPRGYNNNGAGRARVQATAHQSQRDYDDSFYAQSPPAPNSNGNGNGGNGNGGGAQARLSPYR